MIVILDFGSQYTQLIARRIRELKVYCEVHSYDKPIAEIKSLNPTGIILSGGPASVLQKSSPTIEPEIFECGIPILGICYGMHLMTKLLGGEVKASGTSEYGRSRLFDCQLIKPPILTNTLSGFSGWMSHKDQVSKMPDNFKTILRTVDCPYAAIANIDKKLYGLQFHPEVEHNQFGNIIISNFIFDICECQVDWNMKDFIESKINEIRVRVGGKKVLCAVSGGVDSTVTAILLNKALGDDLICVFVDNGLLRKEEAKEIINFFDNRFSMNLINLDASDIFLNALRGVIDPERKRKIIGRLFIELFEEVSAKFNDIDFLAQGTLYSDIIESGSIKGPSDIIKSHHNVGGLPEKMNLKLIEPLNELFKDEVREIGKILGIDKDIVHSHPFPGPGLAIRIIGEVTPEKLEILRHADSIITDEIKKAGIYFDIWQSFAVLLPVKTVGVMGDARTYGYTIAIRCVDSSDAMTADWSRIPHDVLVKISNRITNEVDEVNRIVYDITSKPPGTIEWE